MKVINYNNFIFVDTGRKLSREEILEQIKNPSYVYDYEDELWGFALHLIRKWSK